MTALHITTNVAEETFYPFLGNALSWLTGTATTKDLNSIKKRVNQLITAQNMQQKTLVHIISILNITRYAIEVNRQHINIVIDAVDRMQEDINNLYNITNSLYNSLSYYQFMLHIHSILANHRNSLLYMREVSMCTMDYIDAATTRILSPQVLPIKDLRQMLLHIEEHYLRPCIYQSHLRIHYTSTDTYAPTFLLSTNHSCYSLM